MRRISKQISETETTSPRVLGRGLRAERGVRITIRTLREAAGRTQIEIAQETGMNQADVSRLETRTDFGDCQVSTLRRYIEALGGQLELVARFDDKKMLIAGVEKRNDVRGAG